MGYTLLVVSVLASDPGVWMRLLVISKKRSKSNPMTPISAQTGQFTEAVETAQRSLKLATAQNNTVLADALRTEIGFYEEGFPYWNGK
jgi:hypothetical protein